MKAIWERLRPKDCDDSFISDSVGNPPPPRKCFVKQKRKHNNREPGLLKEEFRFTEMLCLCSKTYCCYDVASNKFKFSSKGLIKRVLEESGDRPLENYRHVLG